MMKVIQSRINTISDKSPKFYFPTIAGGRPRKALQVSSIAIWVTAYKPANSNADQTVSLLISLFILPVPFG